MVDAFTKRNHYNPCFWTALWNNEYFEAFMNGTTTSRPARQQVVHALNVRSGRVYATTVESVHYDKGLGLAEITPDAMKKFCRRRFPQEYERLSARVADHPESLWMDFEDILSGVEGIAGYEALMDAARRGSFVSAEHKGFITCLLIIHAMRSHEMMASMIESTGAAGMEKWEYFWLLKNAWGSPFVLARATTPLAAATWVLYRTADHRFPLCDSPVMIGRDTVMAILAPRLLVEIHLNARSSEDQWVAKDGISSSKYREFRRRAIANAYREIIAHDGEELDRWRSLPEFKRRRAALSTTESERRVTAEGAARVAWALGGFGRVPAEFDSWVRHHFDA
jgi:hypothetical protein